MKNSVHPILVISGVLASSVFFSSQKKAEVGALAGSWHWQQGTSEAIISVVDGYCVFASFDTKNKNFEYTWGGPCHVDGANIVIELQFNTRTPPLAGTAFSFTFSIKNKKLIASFRGFNTEDEWDLLDNGNAPLAGVWRITGRKQGEQMNEIQLGPRRTLKILSGTRFQWVAINIDTKEFFGTGGGRYTYENDNYTEYIEFFSRDPSRVGSSLGFQGKIENGAWHHSGLSSKGEPIDEIWKRLN